MGSIKQATRMNDPPDCGNERGAFFRGLLYVTAIFLTKGVYWAYGRVLTSKFAGDLEGDSPPMVRMMTRGIWWRRHNVWIRSRTAFAFITRHRSAMDTTKCSISRSIVDATTAQSTDSQSAGQKRDRASR